MTKIDKLIEQFLRNPSSLSYSKIEKILLHFSFKKINAKGSHNKFKNPAIKYDLIIPVHNKDCKKFYKKLALKIIKSHFMQKSNNKE